MQTAAVFLCVHYYPVFPHMFKGFVYHSRLCYIHIQPHPSSQTLANRDLLFCIYTICTWDSICWPSSVPRLQYAQLFCCIFVQELLLHALDNATTSNTYFVFPSCRHTVGSTTSRRWYLQLTTATQYNVTCSCYEDYMEIAGSSLHYIGYRYYRWTIV